MFYVIPSSLLTRDDLDLKHTKGFVCLEDAKDCLAMYKSEGEIKMYSIITNDGKVVF